MIHNPIQFAVVREDPRLEESLVREYGAQRALLIASGGCTAFHLKSLKPDLHLTLVDPNPHQLALVRAKERLLLSPHWQLEDFLPLTQCGNFESLFSLWRQFVEEFVVSARDLREIVFHEKSASALFENPYWSTSFALFFGDSLLGTMFGPQAIQHAKPGSYVSYFQRILEHGLTRSDRCTHYFLHHILWGVYQPPYLPYYMTHGVKAPIERLIQSFAQDVTDFSSYDLISLSNIVDWMSLEDSANLLSCLKNTAKPGSVVILRQLNNHNDYDLGPEFSKNKIGVDNENSLFYNKITVYRRICDEKKH